jgi:hypothetical protein
MNANEKDRQDNQKKGKRYFKKYNYKLLDLSGCLGAYWV